MFSSEVYVNRRNKLRKKIKSGIILLTGNNESPMNYPDNGYHFRQDSNFLYFFGIDLAGMIGIIDVDNNIDYIFANDYDIDDIIWMGPQPSIKELASGCGVKNTAAFKEVFDFVKKAINTDRKIHFTPPYRHDNMILLNELLDIPIKSLKEKSSLELILGIVSLRNIKEDIEIKEIERACNIGYLMHTTAMKMAKQGIVEREIAGAIEGISLSFGTVPSFPIILTVNGQTLHNHYHGNTLKNGNLLLIDAGAQTSMYYASDNTRTMPVGGKFSNKQKEIYQIVLDSNNHASSLMKPGKTYKEIHLAASEVLANGLKQLGLMKGDIKEAVALGAHALFMPHGLGHMMGLDVHDMEDLGQIYVGYDDETRPSDIFGTAFLRLGRKLEKGFVLTNEPGCYFIPELIDIWHKEKKFENFINYTKVNEYRDFGGIRLEDDLLITENGARILGDKRIPIGVEEVEQTMNM
ncbi:MAG TPA: aminopeptidase P family protein [Bacteroidales bacterium]|nr:aminopeptidase P family protein [Bacteroidales bacterium]